MKKIFITLLILSFGLGVFAYTPKTKVSKFRNPFGKKDYREKEIQYIEFQKKKTQDIKENEYKHRNCHTEFSSFRNWVYYEQ